MIGLSILLQEICGPIQEHINRSQTHECDNWERGRVIPWKGIHKWDFRCSAAFPTITTKGTGWSREGLSGWPRFYLFANFHFFANRKRESTSKGKHGASGEPQAWVDFNAASQLTLTPVRGPCIWALWCCLWRTIHICLYCTWNNLNENVNFWFPFVSKWPLLYKCAIFKNKMICWSINVSCPSYVSRICFAFLFWNT